MTSQILAQSGEPAPRDARAYIGAHLPLSGIALVPEVRLHLAHAGSGLSAWRGRSPTPPYWAYAWAGGIALARYLLDSPGSVAGRRVLDFGCGCGLVAIAAARAGAADVTAIDIDADAIVAAEMNAEANQVAINILPASSDQHPPKADIVVAGDVFYDRRAAGRSLRFLESCRLAGMDVMVGDPGRQYLPRERLRRLASYMVKDFGSAASAGGESHVYALRTPDGYARTKVR